MLDKFLWGHSSRDCDISCFKHAKSSSQMLNTFEKTKTKKRNVIFYIIIIRFKCCFGELHLNPSSLFDLTMELKYANFTSIKHSI